MSKTLAIFGAGPGLGRSVARRFGREGFRVALVARNTERLHHLADELAADSIEAFPVTADFTDPAQLNEAVATIEAGFGGIDVVLSNTGGGPEDLIPVLEIDTDNLRAVFATVMLSAVTLVRRVLPGMLERGEGTLLLANGLSGVQPIPAMGGVGIALAGRRSYTYNLNATLAERGIYVGALTIGALVDHSDAAALVDSGAVPGVDPKTVERLDPDDLAETCWAMHVERNRVEEFAGDFARTLA